MKFNSVERGFVSSIFLVRTIEPSTAKVEATLSRAEILRTVGRNELPRLERWNEARRTSMTPKRGEDLCRS